MSGPIGTGLFRAPDRKTGAEQRKGKVNLFKGQKKNSRWSPVLEEIYFILSPCK
jgi:hypothetical protein